MPFVRPAREITTLPEGYQYDELEGERCQGAASYQCAHPPRWVATRGGTPLCTDHARALEVSYMEIVGG